MRIANGQLKRIRNRPVPPAHLTDTSGNPSESYYWDHMAAVRREWQHELWLPGVKPFEMTLSEIMSIERNVRKELYP
jgi:hypothetical protein